MYKRKRSKPFPENTHSLGAVTLKKHPSFFRRHGKLFSFFGAILVLATFLVKDLMREQLKELVDSVDKAQEAYSSRADNGNILRELNLLSTTINNIDQHVAPKQRVVALTKVDTFSQISISIHNNRSTLASLRDALELCPYLRDRKGCVAKVMSIYNDAWRTSLQAYDSLRAIESTGREEEERVNARKVTDLSNKARSEAQDEIGGIVQGAQTYAWHVRERYARVTLVSYLLYIFGWSIALAGRLLSVGGLVVSE